MPSAHHDRIVQGSSRNRDRLRYKSANGRRHEKRERSYSPRPRLNSAYFAETNPEQLSADDEAFYGSGAASHMESSLANDYEQDDFKERLFDALADDEGRDHWHQVYNQPVPEVSAEKEMSDDEYAAYVRRGMWERTHAEQIESNRLKTEKDSQRSQFHENFMRQQESGKNERERFVKKEQLQARWKQYLQSWHDIEMKIHRTSDIPWPTLAGTIKSITTIEIEEFLSATGNLQVMAREELRRRWHPDRFQQKTERHVAEDCRLKVLAGVTSVAQSLNEIIARRPT